MKKIDLTDKDKVCRNCGAISGPSINECPNCKTKNFRSLTKRENRDTTPRVIYRRQPPNDSIEQVKTNIFVT